MGSIELFVDVFTDRQIQDIKQQVITWLRKTFPKSFDPGSSIDNLYGLPAGVLAVDTHCPSDQHDIQLELVELRIMVHQLYEESNAIVKDIEAVMRPADADDESLRVRISILPSKALYGSWNELVFLPTTHEKLLNAIRRMITLTVARVPGPFLDSTRKSLWNGMVLLWGPPGSGKSSLCRALSQRLSLRFKNEYPETVMLELDSHALHSKYFSESAKIVQNTFDSIKNLLEVNPKTLYCVVIDEIESLTCSRESTLAGNEPRDAMRAINALLTAIDRLRQYPNLLVFCTTNLVQAMDAAFMDRIDFKWHIPGPANSARYEIFRQSYMHLIRAKVISEDVPLANGYSPVSALKQLPHIDVLPVYMSETCFPSARHLVNIAAAAEGLSARTLARLPWLSLIMHNADEVPCSLARALDALEQAIEVEVATKRLSQAI